MGDYFFNLLPAGHAIRTIPLAAATVSLTAEPAFVVPVGAAANEARRQCAAIAWALSGAFSTAAVQALPTTARTYLARIFGVTAGAKTVAAMTARIDGHRSAHHPELYAAGGNGGGGGGAGGGGGVIPGADDTGGFAAALLSAPRVVALLAIPPGELRKLLDAAGVPQDPAHTGAELRVKCAAAAWAAERRRLATDIQALDGGTQARLLSAFEVPARRHGNRTLAFKQPSLFSKGAATRHGPTTQT